MRSYVKCFVAAMLLPAMLGGCKTTEANYQSAYEKAKSKRTEGLTAEEIAGFRREEAMPKTVYKGDSIPLKGMYVKHVEGGVDNRALTYNVIVAAFKQRFNAGSVLTRMRDGGYRQAVLLQARDGKFYIGAVTTASLDSAVEVLHHLEQTSPVVLREPYPYILKRP